MLASFYSRSVFTCIDFFQRYVIESYAKCCRLYCKCNESNVLVNGINFHCKCYMEYFSLLYYKHDFGPCHK